MELDDAELEKLQAAGDEVAENDEYLDMDAAKDDSFEAKDDAPGDGENADAPGEDDTDDLLGGMIDKGAEIIKEAVEDALE